MRFIAAASLVGSVCGEATFEFTSWISMYEKSYASDADFDHAFANFVKNTEIIRELNADTEDSAEYGHTQFSDLSPEEWHAKYFGSRIVGKNPGCTGGSVLPVPQIDIPASVDWVAQGAVTPIRDQGACGSCWAESAVANIEGQFFLAHKQSMTAATALSTEQVIECDDHNTGCYGGFPSGAYKYVLSAGGLASKADYDYRFDGHTICLANQTFNETCGDGMCDDPPLTSYCDITCEDAKHKKVAHIDDWASLPEDEDDLARHLAQNGPISIAIDASGGGIGFLFPWLQFYKKGVANPKRCKSDSLDHAVTIVGLGEDNGKKYWKIRNSWGEKFGEDNGYFRLLRGAGTCGVNVCATTSVVKSEVIV